MEDLLKGLTEGQQPEQLQRSLDRMTAYAQALEERCNTLWGYVPGNEGNLDPVIQFIAEHLGIVTADGANGEALEPDTVNLQLQKASLSAQEPA